MRNPWKPAQEAAAMLRPAWLAATISLGTAGALHHPQALDALSSIVDDEGFFSWQHLLLLVSLLTLGFCGWYFPRSILYVSYWFTPEARERFERSRLWLPRLVGTAPILSLAVAWLRAGRPLLALFYLATAALFLGFLVRRRRWLYGVAAARLGWFRTLPRGTFVTMLSLVGLSLSLLAVFLASPVAAPRLVGPIGIIFFAMASWIAFGSAALVYPTYHYRLPSLVVCALLLVGLFSFWNDNHPVRTLAGPVEPWVRPTVAAHWAEWLAGRAPARAAFAAAGKPYPVFVVAAEGGGIRAAYWTASVLARLEDAHPGFACHVFAISGVSGGSLGGAVFAALIADRVDLARYRCNTSPAPAPAPLAPRVEGMLGEDFLAPALAGMLFPDFVQRFLPTRGRLALPDRAAYLERSWEEAWRDWTGSRRFEHDFQQLWASPAARRAVPSLFLNGTWVENGGRNVTSNLRPASAAFVELDDALGSVGRPIRLSTAVHMSARFTYLSPAGTVGRGLARRHVVDGGYFENSGALTASEIVAAIQSEPRPSVRVFALIVSNDPRNPANPARDEAARAWAEQIFPESLSPVRALFTTRIARGHHADHFLVESVSGDVLRFQLSGVGDTEVPLGWMLSGAVRGRIDDVARRHPGITEVGRLLEPGSVRGDADVKP